jgi:hypothetical protein
MPAAQLVIWFGSPSQILGIVEAFDMSDHLDGWGLELDLTFVPVKGHRMGIRHVDGWSFYISYPHKLSIWKMQ